MQKICDITKKNFDVTDWELETLKKFSVPLPSPTLCIEERHRRRLAHRNERKIYKSKCALTDKPIISIYSPDSPYRACSADAWWRDTWDGRDFGRDFDFTRPFFEQFNELQLAVPHISLINVNGENSEYCNVTMGNKNSYLVFGGDYNQDTYYSIFSMRGTDNMDTYWVTASQLCYECIDCEACYGLLYSRGCVSCRDSYFLFNCRGCENCFGCVGLVNKKYHIFNQPYSPEEYKKKLAEFNLNSWTSVQKLKAEFETFRLQFPHRFAHIINSESSTGDYLSGCRNCINSFGVEGPAQDLKDVFLAGWNAKDLLSSDHVGYNGELYYECLSCIEGSRNAFCSFGWYSSDIFYCDMVLNSHDMFGCSNMKRSEYCIFNKQYKKEDYFALRDRIVEHMKKTGEWGEFFPIQNSLFAYNETVAQDYFPLTKEEALARGYRWRDEETHDTTGAPVIPDTIEETTDAILQQNLVCKKTGRPYRIIPQELAFYRKMAIPVPHYAPETRNEMRIALRNPIQMWTRNCAKCGTSIETSYAPNRPERVYCEKCYLAEIY